MASIFLGVDIAGKENTWIAGLSSRSNGLGISIPPKLATLREIVTITEEELILSASIDAQLTIAIDEENGFRSGDTELRSFLPSDCRTWVASINSMMAVPVRGQLLAQEIAPNVGTILETHPRASLLFGLGREHLSEIQNYKKEGGSKDDISKLWQQWCATFGIEYVDIPEKDGALDALVCATIAYLFHFRPDELYFLRHKNVNKSGSGPFYVIKPPTT